MNYQNLLNSWIYELNRLYNEREVKSLFAIVAEDLLQWSRIKLQINMSKDVELHHQIHWRDVLERLKEHEPIQHILGNTHFYNLNLRINEHTLIPRPETEELVDLIIKEFKNKESHVLDIGTGSGCIILSLAKHLFGSFDATDVSTEAIKVAEDNASNLELDVRFILDSILDVKHNFGTYDIIVSNPPYIPEKEIKDVGMNVLAFEPHTALFVKDENPIVFYKKIFDFSIKHLSRRGRLYFELNPIYAQDVVDYIVKDGEWECEVIKDLQGKDRMLRAFRLNE